MSASEWGICLVGLRSKTNSNFWISMFVPELFEVGGSCVCCIMFILAAWMTLYTATTSFICLARGSWLLLQVSMIWLLKYGDPTSAIMVGQRSKQTYNINIKGDSSKCSRTLLKRHRIMRDSVYNVEYSVATVHFYQTHIAPLKRHTSFSSFYDVKLTTTG